MLGAGAGAGAVVPPPPPAGLVAPPPPAGLVAPPPGFWLAPGVDAPGLAPLLPLALALGLADPLTLVPGAGVAPLTLELVPGVPVVDVEVVLAAARPNRSAIPKTATILSSVVRQVSFEMRRRPSSRCARSRFTCLMGTTQPEYALRLHQEGHKVGLTID